MIFDHDDLQFTLFDVLNFNDTGAVTRTRERAFCALSLRFEGDTDIITKNETVHMTDGDLAFFPAGFPYLRRSRRDRMIVFHFSVHNHVGYDLEVLPDMARGEIAALFESALAEWRTKAPGYRYRATAALYQIFALLHAERAADGGGDRLSPVTARAMQRMAEQYADPSLSITSLAADAHISDTYFRRIFGHEVGVSPKKYLTDLRLEHAQSLLNAGYDTVAAVAEKVGFGDAKNFSTAFKHRFGYPPSKQKYTP